MISVSLTVLTCELSLFLRGPGQIMMAHNQLCELDFPLPFPLRSGNDRIHTPQQTQSPLFNPPPSADGAHKVLGSLYFHCSGHEEDLALHHVGDVSHRCHVWSELCRRWHQRYTFIRYLHAKTSLNLNSILFPVFPAENQTIAGVFQVSLLSGLDQLQYAFNASEARRMCASLGVTIASKAQVKEALHRGLETCR